MIITDFFTSIGSAKVSLSRPSNNNLASEPLPKFLIHILVLIGAGILEVVRNGQQPQPKYLKEVCGE